LSTIPSMSLFAAVVLATGYTLGAWQLLRQARRRDTRRRAHRWYMFTRRVVPLSQRRH
jgi:hypothetical protein